MSGLINELIIILKEEAEIYDDLIDYGNKKKESIIANDIETLKETNNQENSLAGRLQRLEKERTNLMRDIGNVLNKNPDDITIMALVNALQGQPESKELENIADRLKESINNVKSINGHNKVLIENALDYIDFSMNVMRSSFNSTPAMYDSRGEEIDIGGNLFDVSN